MTYLQILLLSLVQGITEFLPVSSSAHLILANRFLGWPDEGVIFDVAVHLGSLIAVIIYFRKDLVSMFSPGGETTVHTTMRPWMLGAWVVIATIPLGLVGLLGADFITAELRATQVIAWSTLGFGVLLGVAELLARRNVGLPLQGSHAFTMGLAQVFALIPGASRSGVTMTAGIMLGLDRETAARFSFLLAIPAIIAAGVYSIIEMSAAQVALTWGEFLVGVVASGVGAWFCIDWFLKLLNRVGLLPFVIYRLVLGVILLAVI